MAILSRSDYITRYLSFNELPENAFDIIINDILSVDRGIFSRDEFRICCLFMPIAIYNRGNYYTHFSLNSLSIKSVSVRNSVVSEFESCAFSADNRFIDLYYGLFEKPERFDFRNTFFSSVAYPILHSISVGPLNFVFEIPLAYNFVLSALKYADKRFDAGIAVAHQRLEIPSFYIDSNICKEYGIVIQEDSISPIRVQSAEVGSIHEFNMISWGTNPPGVLELTAEEWQGDYYEGRFFISNSVPVTLEYLHENRDLNGQTLEKAYQLKSSDLPNHSFLLCTKVHTLDGNSPRMAYIILDGRSHDFTICGNPETLTIVVWEECDAWCGTIFHLNDLRDYYQVGAWLSSALSKEKCRSYISPIDKLAFSAQDERTEGRVNDALSKLEQLIGLSDLKRDVLDLISLVQVQKMREARGLKIIPVSKHLVFTGNPGTGKTTVARILAEIYRDIGVLSTGKLVEVDRSGLVAGYVGQTALKTRSKIDEALGGILFIDEAYTLNKDSNDFGQEAIDTILKAMEDHRDDFVVIVAGYPGHMEQFINSNPGLRSRFNKYIYFPDYSEDELIEIFDKMCAQYDYKITTEAHDRVAEHIRILVESKDDNFANAREIRNIFESMVTSQASRIVSLHGSNDDVMLLTIEDCMF